MREIKFRSWDKRNKRMREVDEIYTDKSLFNLAHVKKTGRCQPNGEFKICKSNPLLQYTGVKDKNGKEIYEGDILRYLARYPQSHQELYPHRIYGRLSNGVKYSASLGSFLLDDTFKNEEVFCGDREAKKWEIVGNIYENPELLEKNREHSSQDVHDNSKSVNK